MRASNSPDWSGNGKALDIGIYPESLSVGLNVPGVGLYCFPRSVITAEICVMSRFRIEVFSDRRANLEFPIKALVLQCLMKAKKVYKQPIVRDRSGATWQLFTLSRSSCLFVCWWYPTSIAAVLSWYVTSSQLTAFTPLESAIRNFSKVHSF